MGNATVRKTALRGEQSQGIMQFLVGCTHDTSLANERMHDVARTGAEKRADTQLGSRKSQRGFCT